MEVMTRIFSAVQRAEGRFMKCVAIALGVGSIGWGMSILLMPEALHTVWAFRVTVEWASPHMWGASIVLLGAVLIGAAFAAARTIVWPAAGLSVIYTLVSISVMVAARTDQPAPTAIWAYLTLGAISGLLAQAATQSTSR